MNEILKKFIIKYGEKEGIKKYRYDRSLECCILKYGEEEGKTKYKQWCINVKKGLDNIPVEKKREISEKISKELKGRKGTWHNTLDEYIEKYGEEDGKAKYKIFRENLKKYSLRGNEIVKKMKYINSLDYYIDKYGEKEGKIKYKQWCKSQDHGSLNFFIKKYGEENGRKKYLDVNLKKNLNRSDGYFSKVSQILFKEILNNLSDKQDCYFATHLGELKLYYTENGKKNRYCYDFLYKDKIIEYNGDWFHRNPEYYDSTIPENAEILKRDTIKLNFAKDRGYSVLIVWDLEYKMNPEKILKKCLDYLLSN